MNVVSCYQAAKVAGVSRQRIGAMKKANADDKGKYPFFAFDKDDGHFGVDLDHQSWLEFVDRRASIGLLEPEPDNRQSNKAKQPPTKPELDISTIMQNLLSAVDGAISEVLKPSKKKMDAVKAEIVRRYSEMVSNS